jgi:hypothetical protein
VALLAALGLAGSALAAGLAAYRWWFLGASIASLAVGYVLILRRPKASRWMKLVLVLATLASLPMWWWIGQ